ncbi:MAG: hypothetical protein OXG26_03920, partial [Caldilineaceae bacterium]|nr:hypothetical protein [Caldilineaceae bacterium]
GEGERRRVRRGWGWEGRHKACPYRSFEGKVVYPILGCTLPNPGQRVLVRHAPCDDLQIT